MMKISLIVVVDEAWGIGKDNHLLCHLPADLKHFKQLTLGKPILMGRKTFDSIGSPLPGRRNIVLTRHGSVIEGVETIASLNDAWTLLHQEPEVMVIGGAQIFEQTLARADRVYLTQIHHRFEADTFFPRLNPEEWEREVLGDHPVDERHAYAMTFWVYWRKV